MGNMISRFKSEAYFKSFCDNSFALVASNENDSYSGVKFPIFGSQSLITIQNALIW